MVHRVRMREAGARGPATPPNTPPTSMIKGVSPRAAPVVQAKGSPPAPPVTPAKPKAPLAPKIPPQPSGAAAKPVRQPSSPDLPVAPLPPWRTVPDASNNDDTQVDRAPAAALLRAAIAQAPVAPVVQPPVAPVVQPPVAPVVQPPVTAPAPPSIAPVDVSFDRASVAVPPLPREDAEIRVRATVAEAVAPLNQTIRELLRRVEELERRPVPQPAAAVSVVASPAVATPADAYRQPQPSYPAAISVPAAPPSAPAVIARAPTLDVAAIERDVHIDVDFALDGRRRRRRLAITFVLFLVVVFGGLFAALANSYTPHP
jgi:hypothetical protein